MEKYQVFASPEAIKQISLQLIKRNTPNSYLRLGVKGAGCVGFSYHFQFEDAEPREKDLIFEFENIKVIIDHKSIIYLNGATLDWEKNLLRSGYIVINPNEKQKCGCGISFSV